MNWCRYHGIVTPARYFGGPTGEICGYLTNPPIETSACTSPVYDLDIFEIDQMVEIGLPERISGKRHNVEEMKRILKEIVRIRDWSRGDGDDIQLGPQERNYLHQCIDRFDLPAYSPGSQMGMRDATLARLSLLFIRAANEVDER
jgi:hypothetical protein